MESEKTIKHISSALKVDMGGLLIDQALPNQDVQYLDPFILIHHHHAFVLPKQRENEVGIPPHPHRGFCPITFVYKGNIVHRDSLGNKETVTEGETQWMFAGRGITHSERHTKELAANGGEVEILQFWVNVPAILKMNPPNYKAIHLSETPSIRTDESMIYVVAGAFKGHSGPAPILSNQILLRCELKRNGEKTFNFPKNHNTLIYLLDGELKVNGKSVLNKQLVQFKNGGERITVKATFTTRFVVFSGEPLNEKMEHTGPYVMTNQTEIMEAFRDANQGRMGILIEEFDRDDYYIE